MAGLLTGCRKVQPDTGPADIKFDVSKDWQLATRGLATSVTDLQAKSFAVLGKYSSGDSYNASALSTVFDNQEVHYDTSSEPAAWVYEPIQRWNRNSTYRFCAYWPKADGVTLDGDMNSEVTLSNFTVAAQAANQVDLLISDTVAVKVGNPRTMSETGGNKVHDGIPFRFHHILCYLQFKVKKSDTTPNSITITGLRLSGVKNSGAFSMTGAGWTTGSWTASGSGNMSLVGHNEDVIKDSGDGVSIVDEKNNSVGFIVIPQTPAGTEILTIEYISTPNGGLPATKRAEFNIPTSTAWQINKKITYQLAIDEHNNIIFGTPTVDDWGTAEASGTIIIK